MKNTIIVSVFILFTLAIGLTTASVVDLTDSTFNDIMNSKNDEHKTMIKFYAPWCGHCKAMAPAYDQLAEAYAENNKVTIARVDCTKNDGLCTTYGIRGFPTVKMIVGEKVYEFQGARDVDSLKNFIDETYETAESTDVPNFKTPVKTDTSKIVQLTDANFETFVKSITGEKRVFLKFYAPWCGHCRAFETTVAELATHYTDNKDVIIARIDCTTSKEICHTFAIRGYPTTKLIYNQQVYEYKSSRSFDAISKFIEGGFKETEPTAIPSTSFLIKFMTEIDNGVTMIIADFKELQDKKKGVISVIIMLSLSIGCTLGFCAGLSCWCLVSSGSRGAEDEEEDEDEKDSESKKNK